MMILFVMKNLKQIKQNGVSNEDIKHLVIFLMKIHRKVF
jgi:hypothetical protein